MIDVVPVLWETATYIELRDRKMGKALRKAKKMAPYQPGGKQNIFERSCLTQFVN